ncbi:MAG: DUF4168 domain-containing protein [Prolixibacteraceae bacterium]|jgi:hypothetical protein|nr:DUF4168 domain-containing protein [Prolixibacteraceae bacterium]
MRKMTILLSIILFSSVSLIAQNNSKDVTDAELAKFAEAYKKVQTISQESQQKMINVVKEEGLEVQRYNTIMKSQQNNEQGIQVSDVELEKVQAINGQLKEIDTKANKKLQKSITDNDITVTRYQEIMASLQSDQQLQMKLQKHLQN